MFELRVLLYFTNGKKQLPFQLLVKHYKEYEAAETLVGKIPSWRAS